MAEFNHILAIDESQNTVEVEGGATYGNIARATLRHDLLPTITPELKDITAGGAIVGIGIESSCFRYGFVHDGLHEADVLLADGDVITCTSTNEFKDLFKGLPNSYGTLGYVLRAKLQLVTARPYVRVTVRRFTNLHSYIDALRYDTEDPSNDFVEGLVYDTDELYAIRGHFEDAVHPVGNIHGLTPYYKQLRDIGEIGLRTEDYVFRYDPDWFWNVPTGGMYTVFRLLAPRSVRHSSFYKRYSRWKAGLIRARNFLWQSEPSVYEPLIQDWQVPWDRALEFVEFALNKIDLRGKPWACVPIRPRQSPTLYPVAAGSLYFNLGCYCWMRSQAGTERFDATRLLDNKCFGLGGLKMLYSSTFIDECEFQKRFNGDLYRALKQKYDPNGRLPTVYQKVMAGE